PISVAGVFLKFPFTGDPRPVFRDEPAPREIPTTGSITDAFHQRIQEIDHDKGGRTAISRIPPERFGVAIMELAMGHGGVQSLLYRLRDQGSPLFRPLLAVGGFDAGAKLRRQLLLLIDALEHRLAALLQPA